MAHLLPEGQGFHLPNQVMAQKGFEKSQALGKSYFFPLGRGRLIFFFGFMARSPLDNEDDHDAQHENERARQDQGFRPQVQRPRPGNE